MKRAFTILWFLLMVYATRSYAQQNLVYNGDFEIYDTCPNNLTSPGDNQIAHCLGWDHPTYATSDYYNACSSIVGIPINFGGIQIPLSGTAYCGFFGYSNDGAGNDWWEYAIGQLNYPLTQNKKYLVSFYVSLGEVSDYYIKNIGAFLSQNNPQNLSTTNPLNVIPQVLSEFYLNDTINWIKISDTLTALGGEAFITIGHFGDTLNPDTVKFRNWDPANYQAYYFLDSVSIFEIDDESSIEIPNFFTPNGDNINDVLHFKNKNVIDWNLNIYNRWGINIFESKNANDSWDGRTTSGQECQQGTYFFVLNANGKDKKQYNLKGFIQLIK